MWGHCDLEGVGDPCSVDMSMGNDVMEVNRPGMRKDVRVKDASEAIEGWANSSSAWIRRRGEGGGSTFEKKKKHRQKIETIPG
jgi:hypothetical protein